MKKTAALILLCAALLFAQSRAASPAFTPTVGAPELHLAGDNLTDILRTLYNYAQTGQYEREINQVVRPARDWIDTRTARATPNEKLAAIFDIDETAVSNLPNLLACGFCSSGARAKLFEDERLPAIPQVLDLYRLAKSKGVAVIFITGRTEPSRSVTTGDLIAAGYTDWEDLLMRPSGNSEPARTFKAGVRQTVERKGYKIILNIGDQMSDLIGGYAERTYKLPDPFYFVE